MAEGLGNLWGPEIVHPYRTDAGPKYGPLRYRDAPKTIDVLDALGDGGVIGTAACVGQTGAHVALWQLVVRGTPVEGLWNVAGGAFCRYDMPPPDLGPRERVATKRPPGHYGSGGSGSTGSQG